MYVVMGSLLSAGAQAAPVCQEPMAVARAFHDATVEGDFLQPPVALVSAAFASATRAERACQQREEGICTLDFDPWLDGQDGDIDSAATYAWRARSPASGEVEVRFTVWGEPHLTRLPMVRQGEGCWQVDDVITHRGQSVRAVLAQPVP